MGRRFTAVLGRLGIPTGDGRIISPGGLTSRDLPLPLSWQRQSGDGHAGSVVVARIESLEFHQDMVTATGHMLDVMEAWDAEQLIDAGVIGPSMDLDDMTYVADDDNRVVITSARVAGATLVSIPAFAEVSINLDPMPMPEEMPDVQMEPEMWEAYALTASVRTSGWSSMPIADDTRAWDGSAAAGRVASWAGIDAEDAPDSAWSKYARAFLQKKDDADPHTRGAYGYGIADVIDGTLTIVPKGVFAAAAAVQGARGAKPGGDGPAMRKALSGIYKRLDREPPWGDDQSSNALHASAALDVSRETLPPLEWFARPDLDGPTPLTVTDEGRVFGHIATWGQCHVGLPGCTTPPHSYTNYAHFLRKPQETRDGTMVPVGVITVGGGHADAKLGLIAATGHYDNPDWATAKVFAGEDDYGIWVAGWVLPHADPVKVEQLKTLDVSGDWRQSGGNLELMGLACVVEPGFPVLRRVHFSLERGGQQTLIGQFRVTAGTVAGGDVSRETSPDDARARWAWANRKD